MTASEQPHWLFQELTTLRRELQEQHQRSRGDMNAFADRIDERLASIDAQVKLTNGRLGRAETSIAVLQTKQGVTWAIASGIWALVLVIVGWVLVILKG